MSVAPPCDLHDTVEGAEIANDPFKIQIDARFDDLCRDEKTGGSRLFEASDFAQYALTVRRCEPCGQEIDRSLRQFSGFLHPSKHRMKFPRFASGVCDNKSRFRAQGTILAQNLRELIQ